MLTNGTIQPSQSPWASHLHLSAKKDNGWRPCGDYRMLNVLTIPNRYPIKHTHHFAHNLVDAKYSAPSIYLRLIIR